MNNNVFINCPFDDIYIPFLDSILFSIYFCNFKPRCALEIEDGTQNRLEKIYNIIEDCDLGIHDISRTELNAHNLPRFNMPFEFGIFLGAKRYGSKRQKIKSCLILDTKKFRYQEFISDIAGHDIKAHNNNPRQIIKNIRNWLNSLNTGSKLPGATAIINKYEEFLKKKPQIFKKFHLALDDVEYADNIQIIEEWINQNPI
ncbi:MAG: hypothetical protein JRJ49_06545 [Deltaproteobacteria bacterium]|nr:hypothetical protein [Deltaproteobacteria bacterium]